MQYTSPDLHKVTVNGIQLAYHEWGAEYRDIKPTLLFVHATGFHSRCWDEVIRRLGAYHVIAVDQRAHGHSENASFDSWRTFADDLGMLLIQLDLTSVLAIGHSMGAHVLVSAAAEYGGFFSKLLLIDPVILPPSYYQADWQSEKLTTSVAHPAAQRRNHFSSSQQMFERYHQRLPFSLFAKQAMHDYCQHGLSPSVEGDGLQLACPPQLEARIYDSVFSNVDIVTDIEKVLKPVVVVRAMAAENQQDRHDFRYSPTWPQLAQQFPQGRDIYLPALSHFLPLQDPQRMAALIQTHLL